MEIFWLILILFILFDLLLVAFIFYRRKKRRFSKKDQIFFRTKWAEIEKESSAQIKTAILEADKLLYLALSKKGYTGSLGEKLKKSGSLFKQVEQVWSAHKMRNRIAHEIDLKISGEESRKTLFYFKQSLRDLGVKL